MFLTLASTLCELTWTAHFRNMYSSFAECSSCMPQLDADRVHIRRSSFWASGSAHCQGDRPLALSMFSLHPWSHKYSPRSSLTRC
ncbi:hypothetical protein C8Q72DRAFT_79697 [Fomitopsis betulina]|nr:hypothetical protein C8Q72DRAFT_79697 [Fomitopsis betulina]